MLSTETAAAAAGVKPVTIHQWARRGYIRNYGDGYRALWDMAELGACQREREANNRRRVA